MKKPKIMDNEFIMKEFPMDEKDIRELSCKKHEGKALAQCLEQKVAFVCKHCGKLMGESDDQRLFERVFKAEMAGNLK